MIKKRPWLAGLLSFLVPGLGHLYIGQIAKAIYIHAAFWVYPFLLVIWPVSSTFIGLIALACVAQVFNILVCWYTIVDAKKCRLIERRKYDRWYVYLILLLVIMFTSEWLVDPVITKHKKVQFSKITSMSMSPLLGLDDKFAWLVTKDIERGDVAIFEFPGDTGIHYVYRCAAAPGDKLELREGKVYIDDNLADVLPQLKFNYLIKTDGTLDESVLEQLGVEMPIEREDKDYLCNLSAAQRDALIKMESILEVSPNTIERGIRQENLFPGMKTQKWNRDFYGPVIIPKKGQTVKLDSGNSAFYASVIQMGENRSQVRCDEQGLLSIDGKQVGTYTFNHDYYFMIGDNRHNAADSRYRGLVPDSLLKGKARYIWWSDDLNKIGTDLDN